MRPWFLCIAIAVSGCLAAPNVRAVGVIELRARRQRAAQAFSDGVLLVRSKTALDSTADGYREGAAFYYLTGLENFPGAILAIDGKSRETWLFVPKARPDETLEVQAGDATAQTLGLDNVVDWMDLGKFLTRLEQTGARVYCERGEVELPPNISLTDKKAASWIQVLEKKWPGIDFQFVDGQLSDLMSEESPEEQKLSRAAASATVTAAMAAINAVWPATSQRSVELAVEGACWNAGAHGVSF